MKAFCSTTTASFRCRWSYLSKCQRYHGSLAQKTRGIVDANKSVERLPEDGGYDTFEALGVPIAVAKALYTAFPNVLRPTDTQTKFVPAVLEGRDVMLKDHTGTGKSFGLLLGLLSKPRLVKPGSIDRRKTLITSLYIVPHKDLAYQIFHWIQRMCEHASSPLPLPSVAQIVVRGTDTTIQHQISSLRKESPHVVVGTPQALLDIYKEDKYALQLSTLSAVVIDEADYLIESIPKKDNKRQMEKERKRLDRHPSATKQLLDAIYAPRVQAKKGEGDSHHSRHSDDQSLPQLILASATLRNHLKLYVDHCGWLKGSSYKKVKGPSVDIKGPAAADSTPLTAIRHCALVVYADGEIRNIEQAQTAGSITEEDDTAGETINADEVINADHAPELPTPLSEDVREKFGRTPSPYKSNTIEAIATAFAVDVPAIALLVLPSSAPVQRAVYDLRELGVNAYGLDLLADDRGRAYLLHGKADKLRENPTLLVATLASTRGLDLPELTHVFILGIPEGRTVDAYLHIAGRVGRFGRGGKVISVVETAEDYVAKEAVQPAPEEQGPQRVQRDQIWQIQQIYKALDILPTQFDHFD